MKFIYYYGILMTCATLFAQMQVVISQSISSEHIVECKEQQESCICRPSATRCIFRLEIEELQTFTSYNLTEDRENLFMRGTAGDVYYLDANGYTASVANDDCPNTPSRPPECGVCRMDSSVPFDNEELFLTRNGEVGCTIPMTVDGTTYRLYIAVNGRIPGPTLIVTEGQEMIVDVYNNLTSEGVTIHWHGIHQTGTPWMDGVASLSHIPIVPRGRFRYKFTASPSGTHWYHSHLGAQRTDGLFGALIVRERSNVAQLKLQNILGSFNDIPENYTLTLLDWQRESSLNLFVQIHSTLGFFPRKNVGVVPNTRLQNQGLYFPRSVSSDRIEVGPVPYYSGLINGKGRYDPTIYSILSVFEVDAGAKYRFRLVGAQSLYAYRFEIEGHKLWVVASDGHFINPTQVDYIIIHSGERFDFILSADQPVGNYWIKATTLETEISQLDGRQEHSAEAVLHYKNFDRPNPAIRYTNVGSTNSRQCTPSSRCIAVNCPFREYPSSVYTDCIIIDQLQPLINTEIAKLPDIIVPNNMKQLKFFNFGFEGRSSTSAINGRNFIPPATPHQTYPGQYDIDKKTCDNCMPGASVEACVCIYTEELVTGFNKQDNKPVVMVFSAAGPGQNLNFSHPIHLHGHSFFVVYVGHGVYTDGVLQGPSSDIDCRNDPMCRNPRWMSGVTPISVQRLAVNGRLGFAQQKIRKDTVIVPACRRLCSCRFSC